MSEGAGTAGAGPTSWSAEGRGPEATAPVPVVPASRSVISEVVTGLGMTGFASLDDALAGQPSVVSGVGVRVYEALRLTRTAGSFDDLFMRAWNRGEAFRMAPGALAGRYPRLIEWVGPRRQPAYDQIPADLYVDDVFLVSCKFGSRVLFNASPGHLFERGLAQRHGAARNWFEVVQPELFAELWRACRDVLARDDGLTGLPELPGDLNADHRRAFKSLLRKRDLGERFNAAWREFSALTSIETAARWNAAMSDRKRREEQAWRLLRLQPGPYFVLGYSVRGEPIAVRVLTPRQFRDRYEFIAFDAFGSADGQPVVKWHLRVRDRLSDLDRRVEGSVEVRWSHGRFQGHPEAKVYLNTPHEDVAGYEPITADA